MIEYLGGECVKCKSKEKLEIDHIDPKTKEFSPLVKYSLSKLYLLPELNKCQLLCEDCHRVKTREVDGFKAVHGSGGMYRHHGCRCLLCKEANRQYYREYRERREERKRA